MPTIKEVIAKAEKAQKDHRPIQPMALGVTREQIADKLFSDSCAELAKIRNMLEPAFARHQKALDAMSDHGREVKYPGMGKLLTEAWREFQVQQQVERERVKT